MLSHEDLLPAPCCGAPIAADPEGPAPAECARCVTPSRSAGPPLQRRTPVVRIRVPVIPPRRLALQLAIL